MEWFDPQPLLDWLAAHPGWGALAVFLVAFAESLALVGLIVPGSFMMFGVGALVALGALPFWPTLGWAFLGALAGDAVSFWLGRRYGNHLRELWPLSRHPEILDKGIEFFSRHGGKSILLGRFVGPVRPVVPAVAGMCHMPAGRFLLFNLISAAGWAPAYLLPGIALGASLALAAEVAGRLAVLVVLLAVLLGGAYWLVHHAFLWLYPHAEGWARRLLDWSHRHPLLGRPTAALIDPGHPEPLGLLFLAVLVVSAVGGFAALGGAVLGGGLGWDAALYQTLQGLRGPAADHLMVPLSQLADGKPMVIFAALVALWLGWRRDWPGLAHWLAAVAFAALAPTLLKQLLAIPRPGSFAGVEEYAFPSGHATRAALLFGFLAVMVARGLPLARRWIPYAVAGVAAAAVAFARVYLGVHWPSDVLGGLVLGLAWAALLGIAYARHAPPPPAHVAGVALTLLVAIQLPWSLYRMEHDLARYAPRVEVAGIVDEAWWGGGWAALPERRNDVVGHRRQAMTLQWRGELAVIREALERGGWQEPPPFGGASALRWLSSETPLAELPALPRLHDGRHEALLLALPDGEEAQWLLRLWHSGRESGAGPVWIGYLDHQRLAERLGWFRYPHAEAGPVATDPLNGALADWEIKKVLRSDGATVLLIR